MYDDEPWIEPLAGFVRAVHDARVPCVGICFGHQLLAHALGGRTERAAVGWGVGALPMTVTDHEPWMEPELATVTLLYSHQDQVTALPADGGCSRRPPTAPSPCSRSASDLIGIQAHPEFGAAYLRALLEERVDPHRRGRDGRRPGHPPTSRPTSGRRPAGSSPSCAPGPRPRSRTAGDGQLAPVPSVLP